MCGVNGNGTDVVWMCLKRDDFLGCVVVVDAEVEIIGAANDPVLARDEAPSAYRNICKLKGFDDCLTQLAMNGSSMVWNHLSFV